jgi:signal transduction histidine kinase
VKRRARSFGHKLSMLVLTTTTLAALVVAATFGILEQLRLKPIVIARVTSYGEVTAIHSTAALRFDDSAAGAETLSALRAVREVAGAFLYDAGGEPFAAYTRAQAPATAPPRAGPPGARFADRALVLTLPIEHQEQHIGSLVVEYDLTEYYAAYARRMGVAALSGAAAVLIALLLAYRLRRGLERPVSELARAARAISQTKDYRIRAQKVGDDELGDLTDTFNDMLTQIEQYQQLQQAAEDHRRRYTADLERSNRELDEFAYVASHDLRSPLQGIKNLAKWIEEDNAGVLHEQSLRHLRQMQQRVARLERLLDDLLQYSRAGRVFGELVEVDTRELIRETVGLLAPPSAFRVDLQGDMPTFVTAKVPLEQVFRNLINNAIKHHDRPDGRLEISCRENGAYYAFAVADDGPGIPPESQDQIFRMFETLKPRDAVEGSGMGLAIIKKIVESLGGRVGVESEPGQGARFWFTWPKTANIGG